MFKDAQILIVDDQDANVLLLVEILKQAGYTKLIATTDPRRFLPLFVDYRPDIILLDLHMPHLDGFALLDRLKVMKNGGGGQWDPAIVDVLLTTAPHADSVEASESRDRLRAQA